MCRSFFPGSGVVFGVGEDGANIDLPAVIVKGGDEAHFVSADIEDGEFSHEIGAREGFAQVGEGAKMAAFHQPIPVRQRALRIGMLLREIVQAFARDDVHSKEVSHKS